VLCLGSDWPIAPFDPRGVLAAAQLRRPPGRPDLGPVAPEQALTAEQALEGYTTAPAYAAGLEGQSGRIRAGFRADLTVLADDPVHVPAEELPAVPVTSTVVDGALHRW
jgi:predicted amidohydrolase YtcJ